MPASRRLHSISIACQSAAAAALLLLFSLVPRPAAAQDGVRTTSSLERHWTSNAFDRQQADPDWYTLLRSSLEWNSGGSDANVTLGAQVQATRYDTASIEDDRALALTAQAFRRLPSGIEIKGTFAYHASSEGDDLPIGPLNLGLRTVKQVFGATGQIGIDLGNSTTLVLDVSDSFEKVGPTRFQYGLLAPVQLDPDLNRAQAGARLTRTVGPLAFGASGSALRLSAEELGYPPVALSLSLYGLRGEIAYSAEDGSTLALKLGGELLHGDHGSYQRLRPAWQASLSKNLPHGLEIRGSYFGRFETVDSDDPLASWLERGELELGAKLRENLAVAAGVFAEEKQNLLFENVERKRGFYTEATCQATASAAIVLRVDFSRTFKTIVEERLQTVDTFVGVRVRI